VALCLILSLTSIGLGYQLGRSFSLTSNSNAQRQQNESDAALLKELAEEERLAQVERESAGDIPDGDLAAVSAGFLEPCKMVCVPFYLDRVGDRTGVHG